MKNSYDLSENFGARYRITLDEAAFCEPGGKENPWYFQIPCKYGHIYPCSDKLLAFFCESGGIRRRLRDDHPELEVRQWSEVSEAVFLFKPEQLDLVAQYAKPRRKRRLSPAHRKKLSKSGRGRRFLSKTRGSESSSAERDGLSIKGGHSEHG